jgi:transcriptional regulator with XRE-family HTH domain
MGLAHPWWPLKDLGAHLTHEAPAPPRARARTSFSRGMRALRLVSGGGNGPRGYGAAMAARRDPGTKVETKLARVRMSRAVTQEELADAIGISEPTYRRLERGQMTSPPLGYLVNAALALGVELDDLIEDAWREWHELRADRPAPPAPDEFWRRPYRPFGPGIDELPG